jgi:hypothetical protein
MRQNRIRIAQPVGMKLVRMDLSPGVPRAGPQIHCMKSEDTRRVDGQTLVTVLQEEGETEGARGRNGGATGARARTLKPFLQKAL